MTTQDVQQQQDVVKYLMAAWEQPAIQAWWARQGGGNSREQFVSELQRASEGSFIYLTLIINAILANGDSFSMQAGLLTRSE